MYNAKGIINKIENKYSIIPRLYNTDINQYLYDEVPFSSTETDRMIKFVTNKAEKITIKETHQAMELLIHNLNSMSSRAGAQVPFSSINYGTDTSHEGRLVVQQLLLATQEGLGEGETPIFPIQIFKVKEGVNLNPKDPNYDLFKLAIQTTSKRLYPNFSFLDAPFNKQYYKENDPTTEVAYMGCRSRVMANAHDSEQERTSGNVVPLRFSFLPKKETRNLSIQTVRLNCFLRLLYLKFWSFKLATGHPMPLMPIARNL